MIFENSMKGLQQLPGIFTGLWQLPGIFTGWPNKAMMYLNSVEILIRVDTFSMLIYKREYKEEVGPLTTM